MSKNNIQSSLEALSSTDVYSLIMFALYKMKDITEYSTLSELVYLLDKDSLFNLLECFGGTTIRIPTVKELKVVVNALLLHQLVNIEMKSMQDAFEMLDTKEFHYNDILETYEKICSILANYNFKRN